MVWSNELTVFIFESGLRHQKGVDHVHHRLVSSHFALSFTSAHGDTLFVLRPRTMPSLAGPKEL